MEPFCWADSRKFIEVRRMRGQISPVLRHDMHMGSKGLEHAPNSYRMRDFRQEGEEVWDRVETIKLVNLPTKRGEDDAREDSRTLISRAKKAREGGLAVEIGEGLRKEAGRIDEVVGVKDGRQQHGLSGRSNGASSGYTQVAPCQISQSQEQNTQWIEPLLNAGSGSAHCIQLDNIQSYSVATNAQHCLSPFPFLREKIEGQWPLSPRSPLQAQGSCKYKEPFRPVSERDSSHPSCAKSVKLETPCEIVDIDDDSVDSVAESAVEEVEPDCQSPLQTAGAQQEMQSIAEEPDSPRAANSRKFVVLSSDDESGNEKAGGSGQRRHASSPKKRRLFLEDLVHRRSSRLLQLSSQTHQSKPSTIRQKDESMTSQSLPCTKNEEAFASRRIGLANAEKQSPSMGQAKLAEEERKPLTKVTESDPPPSGSSGCIEDPAEPSDDVKKVKETLRLFNSYYLRYVQDEEGRCRKQAKEKAEVSKHVPHSKKQSRCLATEFDEYKKKSRRPDLKAIKQMKNAGAVLQKTKIIGHIPGVSVGDQFFSRCEMTAIGLHDHWLAGIDCAGSNHKKTMPGIKLPIATSLVLSGVYEDDVDNAEDVIYTGQGGNDLLGNKRQIADQIMERGNLALKNSMEQGLPVRLIRGHKTKKSYTGKVYTYDGLYRVKEFWAEKGISGFTVYKFRLHRVEGQAVLTTDQVHFCRGQVPSTTAELRGLVSCDISGGLERIPVPASNIVDDPPFAPRDFTYVTEAVGTKSIPKPLPARGCTCQGECVDATRCACAMLNGKKFPYVSRNGGRLVEPMDVVYECGPQCGCGPSCSNRVSQRGLHYRLEVFRTANKGWGVRSWDLIPAGAPVCQYTGLLMRADDADSINENDYIFDLDCVQTIKGIGGRQRRVLSRVKDDESVHPSEDDAIDQPEYCINAGSSGNVSRFINHSCEPNLFVQCVLNIHHDLTQPRVFLFASENIHPLQELTYDYGYELDSVALDGKIKSVPCYCGAHGCRKRLY